MDDATQVTHNPAANRFQAVVDDQLAQLQYELSGDRLVITHTLVPRALGGRGLGTALVAAAVAHAAAEGLTIGSQCWFADEWLDRHPDEAARVGVRSRS